MKNVLIYLTIISFVFAGCQNNEQKVIDEEKSVIKNGIRWQGDDETANHMAMIGFNRYITYENSHAFIMSEAAVRKDSSLFASHVILALLAEGEKKNYHKKMANKFVENENETSKLFVSLLNYDNSNDSTREERRKIWTKMHEISNSPFIHYMYIRYMDGNNFEKIVELKNLIGFCRENEFHYTATAANNMMAYLLKQEGDLNGGIAAIEECIMLHPDGYNPLDSRAEFYLYAGDTLNAIQTYKKVFEKYPYASYSKAQFEKLK